MAKKSSRGGFSFSFCVFLVDLDVMIIYRKENSFVRKTRQARWWSKRDIDWRKRQRFC